jgi:amino acid transporter
MVQAAYGLTAFDSVIHMVEEIPAPRQNVPRIIWMAVLFGAVTGFIFMTVCLFCIQNMDNLLRAPLPFIDLVRETVGLEGGATLIALFTFNGIGQGVSVVTTSSRLTWGFARDGGLPRYLSYVDPVWKAPVRALWAQGILISLVGLLYLFSDTVLQAILSVSTIALNISYAIPIVTLLFTGRDQMPPSLYDLGRWGPALNWISIIYCIITTIFFLFPSTPSPTPSDMNYAIAVLGVMFIASVAFWFIKGSQTYLQTEDAMAQILQAQQLELTEEPPRERQDGKKR